MVISSFYSEAITARAIGAKRSNRQGIDLNGGYWNVEFTLDVESFRPRV
jgi:hypothetical protein